LTLPPSEANWTFKNPSKYCRETNPRWKRLSSRQCRVRVGVVRGFSAHIDEDTRVHARKTAEK
jgi:hypothetical protein